MRRNKPLTRTQRRNSILLIGDFLCCRVLRLYRSSIQRILFHVFNGLRFCIKGEREINFILQIITDFRNRHLPEYRVIGFPQHSHILKADRAELKINAFYPKFPAADMQFGVQRNVIFFPKILGFLMSPVWLFTG